MAAALPSPELRIGSTDCPRSGRRLAIALLALLVLLAACGNRLISSNVILDADSTQHVIPGNFVVPGKWDLVYSWDCSTQKSEGFSDINRFKVTIYYTDDMSTAFEHPLVDLRGPKGGGTLHYQRGGEYIAKLDTPCEWRLQVIDQSS